MRLLLEKGVDIELKERISRTPPLWAAENGQEATAQQLLSKGGDVKAKDCEYGWTPLGTATMAAWLSMKMAHVPGYLPEA